jgi:alkylhydroperoxidase family enzyme
MLGAMWIEHVREEDAKGEIARLYKGMTRAWGGIDNIVRCSSLNACALDALLRFYKRVMHGDGDLSLGQREMIAVTVSVLNECEY